MVGLTLSLKMLDLCNAIKNLHDRFAGKAKERWGHSARYE